MTATTQPGQPRRTVDLRPDWDSAADTATVYVPQQPGVEWFVIAVPIDSGVLDDPGVTARQVALDVAAEARETAERVAYDAVLERRRG